MVDQVLTADDAAGMTRAQALRAMATMEGVPEAEKRMAELMLAGPDIGSDEQHLVAAPAPKRRPIAAGLRIAGRMIKNERRRQAEADAADLQLLSGGRG